MVGWLDPTTDDEVERFHPAFEGAANDVSINSAGPHHTIGFTTHRVQRIARFPTSCWWTARLTNGF